MRTSGSHRTRRERPIVLQSFRAPRASTNPYLTQLFAAVARETDVRHFSWARALVGRYDVLHLHWPEVLIYGERPAGRLLRRLLFGLVLVRLRLGRKALVRTVHNVRPHEARTRVEETLIARTDRWTTLWITLVPGSPVPTAAPSVLILHGHYRDWFAAHPLAPPVPGRLLHFGLIRPYKGVEELLDAFALLDRPGATLSIVGQPRDAGLAAAVAAAATADPRVSATLEYVDDARLAAAIGEADVVVLPHREMHSSGSVLLALSLDRRVLVPASRVASSLADEAGPGWVLTHSSALDAQALNDALDAPRPGPGSRPDLSAREWGPAGRAHLAAYTAAVDAARPRRGRPLSSRRQRVPAPAPPPPGGA